MSPESAGNCWCGAHERWVNFNNNKVRVRPSRLQRTELTSSLDQESALWSSVLKTRCFKGRCTAENLAAVSRGVAKRFELSAGLRKEFLKVTTVTRDEAANMVAAGKVRDEPDGWESQPASDHHTGCRDVEL